MGNRDVAADSSEFVAIHGTVAFHAYWMCVLGKAGLGCGLCCRVQAGPDLPAGGRCLC